MALFFGAYQLETKQVWQAMTAEGASNTQFLLWQIRLPRILLSALVGAGLAISGAAIQGLFRNPLADQSLIGVTSGAMLFAVLSIVLMSSILAPFADWLQQASTMLFAFLGGLITTFLVYLLSSNRGKTSITTMLLAGIAISALAAAIHSSSISRLR